MLLEYNCIYYYAEANVRTRELKCLLDYVLLPNEQIIYFHVGNYSIQVNLDYHFYIVHQSIQSRYLLYEILNYFAYYNSYFQ